MHTKNLSAYFQTGTPLHTEVMNLISLNEIVSAQLLITCFRGGGFLQEFLPTLVPLTITKLSLSFPLSKPDLVFPGINITTRNCDIH